MPREEIKLIKRLLHCSGLEMNDKMKDGESTDMEGVQTTSLKRARQPSGESKESRQLHGAPVSGQCLDGDSVRVKPQTVKNVGGSGTDGVNVDLLMILDEIRSVNSRLTNIETSIRNTETQLGKELEELKSRTDKNFTEIEISVRELRVREGSAQARMLLQKAEPYN